MPDNRCSANGERVLADLNALRAFFGDFFGLLSGMKTSVPLSTTVSTFLADMIDLLLLSRARDARLAPPPVGETGVASARATRAEGDHPSLVGREARAGLHERVPGVHVARDQRTARKTGETARVGAGR
jgi:hypothetical protein